MGCVQGEQKAYIIKCTPVTRSSTKMIKFYLCQLIIFSLSFQTFTHTHTNIYTHCVSNLSVLEQYEGVFKKTKTTKKNNPL